MKNTEHILSTLALMALAFTRLVAVYSVAKDQQPTVPTKELCTLLKSAKEPSEHLRIAAYLPARRAAANREAKEAESLAALRDMAKVDQKQK
jgi:hypothetical protein